MNKFLKVKSSLSGDILFTATELSGLVEIINESTLYLPFNNSNAGSTSKISIIGGAGALFQTNADQTRTVIFNALEKINQTGYTKSVLEIVFPGVVVEDVLLIL